MIPHRYSSPRERAELFNDYQFSVVRVFWDQGIISLVNLKAKREDASNGKDL